MARAFGYLRVSTAEQAESGLGLAAQRAAVDAAAARLHLELVQVLADEGVSGALPPRERPELARALAELVRGDVLLVARRDRLGRDLLQVLALERDLEERGVRIVSAAGEGTENDEPGSKLMRRMLDAFAEYERDMARDRTRKSLRAARARGSRAGTVPFGYRTGEDGRLLEDEDEQRALRLMAERRAAGDGYVRVCRALEAAGFRPRGKRWHANGVRSILRTHERYRPSGR